MRLTSSSHKCGYKQGLYFLFGSLWRRRWTLLTILMLSLFYGFVIGVLRGNGEWLYVDEVGKNNFYWGDDAYRWFIARSAWIKPEVYWFNFTLPVWVFLEGLLVTVSQNDLLHARYIKAVLAAISIVLVYKTCIKLNLRRWAAISSSFLLATMPLYVFMGMSFYGESWLAFLITLSMYCYVHEYRKWFLLLVSVMPLVRPEGIFLVMVFGVIFLRQGAWREASTVLFPGLIFLISVFFFSDPHGFFGWRAEASKVYQAQGAFYGWGDRSLFAVFAFALIIPALLGVPMKRVRSLYGFYIAAMLIVLYWVINFSQNKAFFESRYFSPLMPIVVLAFAAFLDGAYEILQRKSFSIKNAYYLLMALVIAVFVSHVYSLTTLRAAFWLGVKSGAPWRYLSTDWSNGGRLYGLSLEEKAYFKEYADVVIKMLRLNPDIKVLMVGNVQAFYFLDPVLIPDNVRIVFSPFARPLLGDIFTESEASGYFAEPPYYGYFNLTDPTYEQDKVLYLDYFPYESYPYKWRIGGSKMSGPNDIFLFGGHFLGMKREGSIK